VLEGLLISVLTHISPFVTLLLVLMSTTPGHPGLIIQERISTSATLGFRHVSRWLGDSTNMPIMGEEGTVLERLLVEGTFDREETSVANMAEEYAMQHASTVGLCLLIHIEDLERRVRDDRSVLWF
jgi:hypothetical protein